MCLPACLLSIFTSCFVHNLKRVLLLPCEIHFYLFFFFFLSFLVFGVGVGLCCVFPSGNQFRIVEQITPTQLKIYCRLFFFHFQVYRAPFLIRDKKTTFKNQHVVFHLGNKLGRGLGKPELEFEDGCKQSK